MSGIGSPDFPGLWVKYDQKERDLLFHHDRHRPDGILLLHHLGPLTDELERRGFDIATLRFSIKRKAAISGEGSGS